MESLKLSREEGLKVSLRCWKSTCASVLQTAAQRQCQASGPGLGWCTCWPGHAAAKSMRLLFQLLKNKNKQTTLCINWCKQKDTCFRAILQNTTFREGAKVSSSKVGLESSLYPQAMFSELFSHAKHNFIGTVEMQQRTLFSKLIILWRPRLLSVSIIHALPVPASHSPKLCTLG